MQVVYNMISLLGETVTIGKHFFNLINIIRNKNQKSEIRLLTIWT